MINAWSLLHDELYGDEPMIETATSKDYNDFWEGDGHSMKKIIVVFTSTMIFGKGIVIA